MMDRKISRKLKGMVLDFCIVPASTYGLEMLALSNCININYKYARKLDKKNNGEYRNDR